MLLSLSLSPSPSLPFSLRSVLVLRKKENCSSFLHSRAWGVVATTRTHVAHVHAHARARDPRGRDAHRPREIIFSLGGSREDERKRGEEKEGRKEGRKRERKKEKKRKTTTSGEESIVLVRRPPTPLLLALYPAENVRGKREWDSPTAMLKPCARVLAFPVVYRLATNTLVPRSRPPPPSVSLTPSIPPTFPFSLFATPSLSLFLSIPRSLSLCATWTLYILDDPSFVVSFFLSPVCIRISRLVIR